MAEAAFSEDGKYYTAITQDGRLRIWDTETNVLKQEYTPDLHLTSPPSCVQWITVGTSANRGQKGKRKSSEPGQEAQCIAVGTTSGKILIYSVAKAKVDTVLEEKSGREQNWKITCLDWNRSDGLFSCNKGNFVCCWRLDTSKKQVYNVNTDSKNKQVSTISALKILPHKLETNAQYVITASWQLRVWRFHEGTANVVKCLGHNTSQQSILAIAETKEKTWVIEGSQMERLLSFWDVTITTDAEPQTNGDEPTPKKKQRKKSISSDVPTVTIPTYNFVLEDAPRMIDVGVKEEGDTRLTLAAATRSGVVHYYAHTLNGASTKPIKPTLTIHMTTRDATPLPLTCCRLPPSGLQVGYLQGATIVFENLTPDLSSKTQVLIREDTKSKKKAKLSQTNEINKVASEPSKDVQYVEPMGGVTRKRAAPGAKFEVPMEARLANLALDTTERDKTAINQNLTRLLVQGLHSKDKEILELVLGSSQRSAAERTVAQLPPEYLPALLEELATRAAKRTSQCASVCAWVHAIVRTHAALLLATMSAHNATQLTRLLAICTDRRSHLCQLLNLKGRLDLTLAQRVSRDGAQGEQEPIIDYNDDTSEEEMELERQSLGSNASFDDQFEHSDAPDSEDDSGGSD